MEKELYLLGDRYEKIEIGIHNMDSLLHILKSYTSENSTDSLKIGHIDTLVAKMIDEIDIMVSCL